MSNCKSKAPQTSLTINKSTAHPLATAMASTENCRQHMEAAIALSERAGITEKTGRCFGAVMVDGRGQVVGEGYNQVIVHDLMICPNPMLPKQTLPCQMYA